MFTVFLYNTSVNTKNRKTSRAAQKAHGKMQPASMRRTPDIAGPATQWNRGHM